MVTEGHSTAALLAEPDEGLGAFDDHALMLRFARAGDRAAMDELVRRHWDVAYRVALRQTGSSADAEDAVQEALAGLCRRADQYDGRGTVRAWLLQSVVNACRMRFRSEVARSAREDSAGTAEYHRRRPSGPDYETEELREAVRAAVGELSETYRVPVWLRYVEDLSLSEIAHALDRNEATVRSQIHRGLKKLAGRLARCAPALTLGLLTTRLAELAASEPVPVPPPAAAALPRPPLAGASAAPSASFGAALPLLAAASLVLGLGVLAWPRPAVAGDGQPAPLPVATSVAPAAAAITAPASAADPVTVQRHELELAARPGWEPLRVLAPEQLAAWSLHHSSTTEEDGRRAGLIGASQQPELITVTTPDGPAPGTILDATAADSAGVALMVSAAGGELRRVRCWIRVEEPRAADPFAGLVFTALVRRGGSPQAREILAEDPAVLELAEFGAGRWVAYECQLSEVTRNGVPATELSVWLDGGLYRRAVVDLRSDVLVPVAVTGGRSVVAGLVIERGPRPSL